MHALRLELRSVVWSVCMLLHIDDKGRLSVIVMSFSWGLGRFLQCDSTSESIILRSALRSYAMEGMDVSMDCRKAS